MRILGHALALIVAIGAGGTEAATKAFRDGQRHMSHIRMLHETKKEAIAWGSEVPARRTTVLTLEPPLEQTSTTRKVEVDIFSPVFDADGTGYLTTCTMRTVLGVWWPTLVEAGVPVHLRYHHVDEGPGLDESAHQGRRTVAELLEGGAIYAGRSDERGDRLIQHVLQWIHAGGTAEQMHGTRIEDVLVRAGIELEAWRREIDRELEQARRQSNERWRRLAEQYMQWQGRDPGGRLALDQNAAPIIVVGGRHLLTMNTIRRQGGRKGPERLFRTVNGLVAEQIESREQQARERGTTMNHTAAAVAAAAITLGACTPDAITAVQNEAAKTKSSPREYLGHEGWTGEQGPVEILPSGTHVRLKSGKVVQVLLLKPLKGEHGRRAQAFLQELTQGRTVRCTWPAEAARKGDRRAVTEDGLPIASCRIRKQALSKCTKLECRMEYQAISNGYGQLLLGPWQGRTPSVARRIKDLEAAQNKARRTGAGLWKEWED